MQIYVYERREERLDGLTKELSQAGITVQTVDDAFFTRDLSLLDPTRTYTRPFLLAATDGLHGQITALRNAGCRNPILVMRDFRNARETAEALNRGADQDLVIPIKGLELKARVHAILRRANGHVREDVRIGEVTAYLDGRDPEIGGQRIRLSRREHAIFNQLALNAGRVVSKAAIYNAVYGVAEIPPYDKVVDVYICKIRKKFDASAESGARYIETVPGRGYRFTADAMPDPSNG